MNISDLITQRILQIMEEQNGIAEIQRNELANTIGCVPSQINYVLTSRFSPEQGYIIESRRGGGGYIKITRVVPKQGNMMMPMVNAIGEYLPYRDAAAIIRNCYDYDLITENEAKLIIAAMTEKALPLKQPEQDYVRAGLLKNMLVTLA